LQDKPESVSVSKIAASITAGETPAAPLLY